MSLAIVKGILARVCYAEEDSYGANAFSGVITGSWPGSIRRFAPTIDPGYVTIYQLGDREAVRQVQGHRQITFTTEVHPILTSSMAYAISNIDHSTSWWIRTSGPNQDMVIIGARPNEMTINLQTGQPAVITTTWWAKDMVSGVHASAELAPAPTRSSGIIMYHAEQLVEIDLLNSGDYSSAVTFTGALTATVTINNNLERIPQFGSVLSRAMVEKVRDITGEIVVTFEDLGTYHRLITDNPFALRFTLGKALAVSKYLTLKYCKWQSFPIDLSPNDAVALRLPFRSMYTTSIT